MKLYQLRSIAVTAMAVFLANISAAAALRYRIVDLVPQGIVVATGINNLGHVVGQGQHQNTLFYDGKQTTDFGPGPFGLGLLGYAINDRDVITGSLIDASNVSHVMTITNGVAANVPGDTSYQYGVAINNAGQILVEVPNLYVEQPPFYVPGYFFLDGGTETGITGIDGDASGPAQASSINTSGQIAGSAVLFPTSVERMPYAMLWSRSQTTLVKPPQGYENSALALNDAGIVVGAYAHSLETLFGHQPYIWSAETAIPLDLPNPAPSYIWKGDAVAINNFSVVVESGQDYDYGSLTGLFAVGSPQLFAWYGGRQLDLNTVVDFSGTPYTALASVTAINDRGEIIGSASAPSGEGAVLLEPIVTGVPGHLVNISVRGALGTGENTCIAGFVVNGPQGQALIRGVGPGLAAQGIAQPAADPQLTLYRGQTAIQANNNWGDAPNASQIAATAAQIGAFSLAAGSKDAALLTSLPAGPYTVHFTGTDNGIVLGEIYDANPGSGSVSLVNLSARVQVGPGEQTAIAGFVVTGDLPIRVLIRAVGPGLSKMGIQNVLQHPLLWLHSADGSLVLGNQDWGSAAAFPLMAQVAQTVGAFALDDGSNDAALLVQLEPGVYTTTVTGADNGTGVVLLEIYAAP